MQPTFFSGRKEYDTTGRRFLIGSLRFGRVIGTRKGVTYQYILDVAPLAVAFNNEVSNPAFESAADRLPKTRRESTAAFAIQPAGFRFIFRPRDRLKPFVQTSAGFIFTRKPMPVPQSPTYNFVGDFGGGVMYSLTQTDVLKAGYRYYHISNMNIGDINPGYNANIFYFGLSRFYK
jgi:hypothetical protein